MDRERDGRVHELEEVGGEEAGSGAERGDAGGRQRRRGRQRRQLGRLLPQRGLGAARLRAGTQSPR